MDFAAAFRFPFRGPHAWPNIGFLLLCFLIPIVGPIVAGGYIVAVEKALIADPLADPPRFDFGRFGDYLQRGIYPFLVGLVLGPVFMLLFMPLGILMAVIMIVLQKQVALMVVLVIVIGLVEAVLALALTVLLQPIALKAGLEQTFKGAFDKKFIVSWWRKVGWQTLGALMLIMVVAFGAAMVLICTIVGIYAVMAVLMLVQAHVQVQLYGLYLARGGSPLAIVPEPLAVPYATHGFPPEPPPIR